MKCSFTLLNLTSARLNTTLAQLLNNLSLKLNSPIKVEQQLPANTPVVGTPVANTPVANTPVANTPVANTPVANTPVANTPVANTPVANTPVAGSSEANKTGSATNNSAPTIGDQNSPPTFNTLQKEIGEVGEKEKDVEIVFKGVGRW